MTTKEAWKPVTISGVTGILMGAGTVYGVQALASGNSEDVSEADSGLKIATGNDNLSFDKAFEAARAEVGPGGVFTWHGNIYNTYTAHEWRAMSHNEKHLFASQVKPEVSAADVDAHQIAANDHVAVDVNVRIIEEKEVQQDHDVEVKTEPETQVQAVTWNDLSQDENDVRILGYGDVELDSGRSITVQELDINGQRVAVIDVDKDGEADLAMSDLNHNRLMDEGEVLDLHTGEPLSFTNDDYVANDIADIDSSLI